LEKSSGFLNLCAVPSSGARRVSRRLGRGDRTLRQALTPLPRRWIGQLLSQFPHLLRSVEPFQGFLQNRWHFLVLPRLLFPALGHSESRTKSRVGFRTRGPLAHSCRVQLFGSGATPRRAKVHSILHNFGLRTTDPRPRAASRTAQAILEWCEVPSGRDARLPDL
jgi:hypothetical protein